MKRKIRYRKIKALRKWRDEILDCDNVGRIKHLIFEHPRVKGYSTDTGGWSDADCTIRFHDGFEFWNSSFYLIDALKASVIDAYKHIADDYLTRPRPQRK